MAVVDLTHKLTPEFPLFPVYDPIAVQQKYTMEEHGFRVRTWTYDEHIGTHVDAPAHYGGDVTVDEIPAEDLILQVAVVDIRERVAHDHDATVTLEDVRAYERRHGELDGPFAILALTGWGERVPGGESAYLNMDDSQTAHFPGFSVPLGDFLKDERPNVRAVGLDTASIDIGATSEFEFHGCWLPGHSRYGIENLANLDQVPERGATLFVGAPAFHGGTGGPSRILALTT
jgi:kynurenine formamidase